MNISECLINLLLGSIVYWKNDEDPYLIADRLVCHRHIYDKINILYDKIDLTFVDDLEL